MSAVQLGEEIHRALRHTVNQRYRIKKQSIIACERIQGLAMAGTENLPDEGHGP